MTEHHDHHDPKPSNKWIATPILAAVVVIALVVGFISLSTGQCCGGKCESKTGTEQHGAPNHDGGEHETVNEEKADTSASTADSNATAPVEEGHEGHSH